MWSQGKAESSPIALTLLEFICILPAIHQELLGYAAPQDAGTSQAPLCVCLYQAEWQLTQRHPGSYVAARTLVHNRAAASCCLSPMPLLHAFAAWLCPTPLLRTNERHWQHCAQSAGLNVGCGNGLSVCVDTRINELIDRNPKRLSGIGGGRPCPGVTFARLCSLQKECVGSLAKLTIV